MTNELEWYRLDTVLALAFRMRKLTEILVTEIRKWNDPNM
jgi:hypothetical protein